MALDLSKVKELIANPKKADIISKAAQHESKIRFHVESFMNLSEASRPATEFLDWVETLIPKDKFTIFTSLFKFPTPMVGLSDSIFKELERVFDGRNPAFKYEFTDSELEMDWQNFKESKKDNQVWRKKGWDAVRTKINSVLVVDMPKEQTTESPEPYFYWLDIRDVIDFGYEDGKITYLIFKQDDNRIAVFDDEQMSVYETDGNGNISESATEDGAVSHDLGFCPARFFWTTELNSSKPELKKSPISSQLSDMDWALFFSISKRHLDLYAPYPIYSAYEADCSFENTENGDYCDGGFIRGSNEAYKVLRQGGVEKCPVCSEKRLAGVGSFIEVPVPTDGDPDLRNPISITTIDKESLSYNTEEVERLRAEIFTSAVGSGGDIQAKQSLNEMQVSANFESKMSVLNSMKDNLEAAMKFVDDVRCRLRYGERYLGSHISMGTEFYLHSIESLYAQYSQAKTNGASLAELDSISDQIIATENKNNPSKIHRMELLKQLEPFRHYTLEELLSLHEKSLIDEVLLRIKINFNTFVDRFERENTNILEFGMQLELSSKIDIINSKFKDYAREFEQSSNESSSGESS